MIHLIKNNRKKYLLTGVILGVLLSAGGLIALSLPGISSELADIALAMTCSGASILLTECMKQLPRIYLGDERNKEKIFWIGAGVLLVLGIIIPLSVQSSVAITAPAFLGSSAGWTLRAIAETIGRHSRESRVMVSDNMLLPLTTVPTEIVIPNPTLPSLKTFRTNFAAEHSNPDFILRPGSPRLIATSQKALLTMTCAPQPRDDDAPSVVTARPAFFAGRGNPAFIQSGSPQLINPNEPANKPGSVVDSHLSRVFVTKYFKRPTRA